MSREVLKTIGCAGSMTVTVRWVTSRGQPGTMAEMPGTASVAAKLPRLAAALLAHYPDVLCPPFAQWLASSLQSLIMLGPQ
jgi:hypothetical protein